LKQAIVIGTGVGRAHWVADCLASLNVPIPVIVVCTDGYELGKIKWVYENTDIDRFIFLQDSVVIKNNELLMRLFEAPGSACLMDDPVCMGSYMGLYERTTLSQIEIPYSNTKRDSINYEVEWTREYVKACKNYSHPVEIRHKIVNTVYKHGRENRLYVNNIYEKWKGTWQDESGRIHGSLE
jgi:hypothetical protein